MLVSEPLTSLNLLSNDFGAEGVAALAPALAANGSLTSLDLSNNVLCEMTPYGGTYTAEGITAIADALRVNGSINAPTTAARAVAPTGPIMLSPKLSDASLVSLLL